MDFEDKLAGDYKVESISYSLGMINCFVEMVAWGVKTLALSPPIDPKEYDVIKRESDKIVEGFGIKSYLTKNLIITDLQSAEFTEGKWSILYYDNDATLKEYLNLELRIEELNERGEYKGDVRKQISATFGKLLSYTDEKIEEKLSRNKPSTPFTL